MLNGQDALRNLNEKFGNLCASSDNKTNSNVENCSVSCYWCDSRGLMQCKHCSRNFCKFCIKNGQLSDETHRVCFICGCFEVTDRVDDTNRLGMLDREMQDMLHRYQSLCNNDKLERSAGEVLNSMDEWRSSDLPVVFQLLKSNILSMLHDIQKVETMVNRAVTDNQSSDVNNILLPLLRVVVKHHVFKRLGRPQLERRENGLQNISHEQIDLTDDRMSPTQSDEFERLQRSPLRLADEEKSIVFHTKQLREDDDNDERLSVTSGGAIELEPTRKSSRRRRQRSRPVESERRSARLRSETSSPAQPMSVDATTVMPVPRITPRLIKSEPIQPQNNSNDKQLTSNNSVLEKFSRIGTKSNSVKNAHLVCPAPEGYEKPFLFRPVVPDSIEDIKPNPPANSKIWSWERQSSASCLPSKVISRSLTTSASKPIVIPRAHIESIPLKPIQLQIESSPKPPLAAIKRSLTPEMDDSDEPRKKRGRPRKYFSNYWPALSAGTELDSSVDS